MKEKILAVKRSLIVDLLEQKEYGLINDSNGFYQIILENAIIVDRDLVENDPSIKQLIPYVILGYNSNYVLLKRKPKQNEKRLHNKMSLGIGGHINPSDTLEQNDIIISGLFRELNEEIHIKNYSMPEFIGYINDDLSDVGSVHLGLLYKISLSDDNFEILEKDKMEGSLVSIDSINDSYNNLESWSKIVFDEYLTKSCK